MCVRFSDVCHFLKMRFDLLLIIVLRFCYSDMQMELSPNPLGLFHVSVWERTQRTHLERRCLFKKHMEGDWMKLLSVGFKGDQ